MFIERLGEFRLRMKHAEIKNDTVYPPYNEVVFSPEESDENNFVLANLVSREKQCLFTEANEMLTAWVDELLAALQHNKSVTYEGFGTFMLDKKGNLSFENEIIPQLNSLFEGMEPIGLTHPIAAVPEEEEALDEEDTATDVVTEVEEPVGANNDSPVEPEPVVEPEQVVEPEPVIESEPVVEPEPAEEPEPVVQPETVEEPVGANNDSPVEPEPVVASEPVVEPEPVIESEPVVEPEPVVESEPVIEPEPVVEPEPNVEPEPVVDEPDDEDDDDDDEDDEEDEEEDDDDDEKKRHRLAWLWILLLLLAVLGALGYIFKDKLTDCYHQWRERKQSVEQVVTTDEQLDRTAESVTAEEPETVVDESETVEEPAPEAYTPEVLKQTADGKYNYIRFEPGHYYAIAGSFPGEADVERHIRQKGLDQYSPVIVVQEGKNLRVCIGVFDTEEEAEQFAKGVNSGYWVLK